VYAPVGSLSSLNPPLFALLTLFLGPVLILWAGRIGILAVLGASLVGWILGAPSILQACLLVAPASYFLAMCGAPGRHPARGIALWSALCCLPLWAPSSPFLWRLWPGLGLGSSAWEPLARGWLYEAWGSGESLPSPSFQAILLSYFGLGLVLRGVVALCPILESPGDPIPSHDET
jgi:hypothetical protein